MKTLYLVRHAKSSWKHPELSDWERPLNKRGKRDAPFMAKLLKEKGITADQIVSSPANRAITTAKKFASELAYSGKQILEEQRIYYNTIKDVLAVVKEIPDHVQHLLIFGHNPSFTELANYLCDEEVDNIPTSAVFAIEFDIESWNQVKNKGGRFKFFEYPKKHQ